MAETTSWSRYERCPSDKRPETRMVTVGDAGCDGKLRIFSPRVLSPGSCVSVLPGTELGGVSCAKSCKEMFGDGVEKISQAPGTHCTRKSPLPLLPSGPGGVGESTSRETDA